MSTRLSTAPTEWRVSTDLVTYPQALNSMRRKVDGIRAGTEAEQVWLLEHPPLYTAGTSSQPADLVDPKRFDVFAAGRGGQWTYHGPGQLIAYVMVDLTHRHGSVPPRDAHAYVRGLERVLIQTLAEFTITGVQRPGRTGIWINDGLTGCENKIASVGVRITRWVTWHGVSLNVSPELDHFSGIVPCGIRDHGITSMRALAVDAAIEDVRAAFRRSWNLVFVEGGHSQKGAPASPKTIDAPQLRR